MTNHLRHNKTEFAIAISPRPLQWKRLLPDTTAT